jgi:hypothetical protein
MIAKNFLAIPLRITVKYFMETRPVAALLSPVDTKNDERTDRHKDANCPFSHFCEGGPKTSNEFIPCNYLPKHIGVNLEYINTLINLPLH